MHTWDLQDTLRRLLIQPHKPRGSVSATTLRMRTLGLGRGLRQGKGELKPRARGATSAPSHPAWRPVWELDGPAPEASPCEELLCWDGCSHPGWKCHTSGRTSVPVAPVGLAPTRRGTQQSGHTFRLNRGGGQGRDSRQSVLVRRPTQGRPGLKWPRPEVLSAGRADHHTLRDSGLTTQRYFQPEATYLKC